MKNLVKNLKGVKKVPLLINNFLKPEHHRSTLNVLPNLKAVRHSARFHPRIAQTDLVTKRLCLISLKSRIHFMSLFATEVLGKQHPSGYPTVSCVHMALIQAVNQDKGF